jgi:hypothetical protein
MFIEMNINVHNMDLKSINLSKLLLFFSHGEKLSEDQTSFDLWFGAHTLALLICQQSQPASQAFPQGSDAFTPSASIRDITAWVWICRLLPCFQIAYKDKHHCSGAPFCQSRLALLSFQSSWESFKARVCAQKSCFTALITK